MMARAHGGASLRRWCGTTSPGTHAAAHVHLDLVVLEHSAVEVRQGDGAELVLLGLRGAQALALEPPVGNGGAARHPAQESLAVEARAVFGVHRRALAGDAAAGHGHRPCEPRQVLQQREVALQDPRVGALLPLQRVPPDVVALQGGEAYGERRQRAAEDGDLATTWIRAQFVAVERQAGFEPQGVAGAEAHGRGARGDQCVPDGRPVVGADEQLERDGLSRVSRACYARLNEASVARQP